MKPNDFIPVSKPFITLEDKDAVISALDAGWVSGDGPVVRVFEKSLCEFFKKPYAVSCSNGTAAVDLAIAVLGLSPGDRAVCPSFTIGSCCFELVRRGISIDFVDSEMDTFNPTEDDYLRAVNEHTRVIIIPHIYGFCVDVPSIKRSLGSRDIWIIEDCAESQFLCYPSGGLVGSCADITTYSFYSNKTVVAGEGGAVLCGNIDIYKKLNSYRNLCFDPNRRFFHTDIGWNYRLGSLSAALANSQLTRGALTTKKKQEIGVRYYEDLCELSQIYIPPPIIGNRENGYWIVPILLKHGQRKDRDHFAKYLSGKGIGTRPFFEPLHLQKVFVNTDQPITLPNCTALGNMGLYIPSFVGISEDEVTYVVETIKDYFL